MTDAADLRQIAAAGRAGDEARSRREALADVVDQIAANLERLDQQHAAEFRAMIERQANERSALLVRVRAAGALAAPVEGTISSASVAPKPNPERQYRPVPPEEEEDWRHVDHAAADLGVSRSTCWRWAHDHGAQWPHGNAQRVDFNKLRHLRPPRGKNGKFGK